MSRAALFVLVVSSGLLAHGAPETRELRLQVAGKRVEGLLVIRVPPATARLLFAAPPERATARIDSLSLRLAPSALRGLRLGGRAPRLLEGKARLTPEQGVEAALLIDADFKDELLIEGALPVLFVAPRGRELRLVSGPGRAVEEGLELHPRTDLPCRVRVVRP